TTDGTQAGDIIWNAPFDFNGIQRSDAELILKAANDIIFNAGIIDSVADTEALNVELIANVDNANGGAVRLNPGVNIETAGGNFSAQGQGQLNNKNGITLDECLINAAGGDITLTGSGYSGDNDNNGIQIINGSVVETTQAGSITLEGQAGVGNNDNHGIVISDANTQLKTQNGSIHLQGRGKGQGRNNQGILFTGGGLISTDQGNILLEGSGGETQSQGIVFEALNGNKTEGISTIRGDVELIGRSAPGEVGLALDKGIIEQLEGGMITLTADEIDLKNITLKSPGQLLLQPLTPSLGITVGGNSDDSHLNLLKNELDQLDDGFTDITIGRDDGQGSITLDGNLTVTDPIILRALGDQGAIATQSQQLKLRGQDNATITLLAQQDIRIADIDNPERSITLDSAQGNIVAGKLQTRGLNGGEINLHGHDIEVALIQSGATQGQGGAVNVTANHLFKVTQGIGCALNTQCSIDSAGQSGGGFIRITHGGNGIVPFIVGDATINGTASSIYSGEANITPEQSFLGEHMQPPNIQIISTASEINAQYQLTLNYSGSGEGYVETTPIGQPCGPHCQIYPAATQVNLIIKPAEHAEFSGWQEDTCKTNQLIMMADQTCTAVFTQLDPSSAKKPTPVPTDYAGVQSNPPPNSELKLGASSLGVPTHARLYLIKQGNLPLIIESATLSGQYANEFKLLEPQLPFTIADAHQPIAVRLACVPAAEGLRTATLTLTTNALQTPEVQYTLTCTGLLPARYSSEPAVGETLNIGQQVVHKAIVQEIIIHRSGEAALEIDLKAISGPHAEEFKIIAPALPTTLEAEQTQQTLRIRCIPADVGLRQATLELTTTDAQNPHPSYALTCTGLSATQPAYTSTPKPGSTLEMGRIAVGHSASQKLTLDVVGEGSLEVDLVALSGEHADDFAIRTPEFPLSLAENTPVTITCTPKATGLRSAQLLLTSNAPKQSQLSYTLVCEGYEAITEVNYSATPASQSVLTFADTPVGTTTTQNIIIQAQGSHELTLEQVTIEGEQPDDFSINETEFPVTLAAGESYTLTVHCAPSSAGIRRAQVNLTTTDPMLPVARYTLKCQATLPVQARYDSVPAPGSSLALGQTEVNQPTTYSLKITSVGAQPLQILTSSLSGQHANEFKIIAGQAPVTVDSLPHVLTLQCTPQVAQKRHAQLTLTTNDPNRAQLHYPLTCFGHDEWANAIILGQIQTKTGRIGHELAVKALEAFKLTGFIAPARKHFDQLADIIVHYRWLPAEGNPLTLPVTLAQQQRLEAKKILEINIFEGNIIDLNGTFEVSLGYKLSSGEWISAEILTLEIQPNQPPTNILLSNNTVAEQSPTDTVIGTFTTVDADQQEQFVYFLTEDAGGHFKVVGNELRTTVFPLEYTQGGQRHITVRSMDMANHTVTKDFLIHVTPIVTEPYQIQLTRQQVLEKSPEGTIVGKFFTQPDNSGNYIYELLDDAEGRFTLVKDLLLVLNGQHLDFERQKSHAITVRSQKAGSPQIQEKTFAIEVVNIVDVQIQEALIRDKAGALLSAEAIEPNSDITIEVQLVADEMHIGRQVELLGAALYVQDDKTTTFKQDNNDWHSWSGDLADLTALETLRLRPQQQLTLFQGQLTQFAGGQLHIFTGYRLPNGEIIFQPNSFNIKINGLEK
ncbi:MAG: choice-of-anchor D domain-containing protein, partial [Pseudomonadota bacterium]|nr:choice-of-anchor D domain-containing protein [Pseudomonadota bacterium]